MDVGGEQALFTCCRRCSLVHGKPWYSLMAVASFSSSNYKTKCFRDGLRSKTSFTCCLGLRIPQISSHFLLTLLLIWVKVSQCAPLLNLLEAALSPNPPAELFRWPSQTHQFSPRCVDEHFHQRGRSFLTQHQDSNKSIQTVARS